MEYEDEEILIGEYEEVFNREALLKSNLVIRLNTVAGTFNVVKNRWGSTADYIPLNWLDSVLHDPECDWKSVLKIENVV